MLRLPASEPEVIAMVAIGGRKVDRSWIAGSVSVTYLTSQGISSTTFMVTAEVAGI